MIAIGISEPLAPVCASAPVDFASSAAGGDVTAPAPALDDGAAVVFLAVVPPLAAECDDYV